MPNDDGPLILTLVVDPDAPDEIELRVNHRMRRALIAMTPMENRYIDISATNDVRLVLKR